MRPRAPSEKSLTTLSYRSSPERNSQSSFLFTNLLYKRTNLYHVSSPYLLHATYMNHQQDNLFKLQHNAPTPNYDPNQHLIIAFMEKPIPFASKCITECLDYSKKIYPNQDNGYPKYSKGYLKNKKYKS